MISYPPERSEAHWLHLLSKSSRRPVMVYSETKIESYKKTTPGEVWGVNDVDPILWLNTKLRWEQPFWIPESSGWHFKKLVYCRWPIQSQPSIPIAKGPRRPLPWSPLPWKMSISSWHLTNIRNLSTEQEGTTASAFKHASPAKYASDWIPWKILKAQNCRRKRSQNNSTRQKSQPQKLLKWLRNTELPWTSQSFFQDLFKRIAQKQTFSKTRSRREGQARSMWSSFDRTCYLDRQDMTLYQKKVPKGSIIRL